MVVVGYLDPEKQSAFQCRWLKKRREQWLAENGPCRQCGSSDRLEVDHIDPSTKIDHKVWSWRKERRDQELKKCQPLCYKCHKKKTARELARPIVHGTSYTYSKRKCRCPECKNAHAKRRVLLPSRIGKRRSIEIEEQRQLTEPKKSLTEFPQWLYDYLAAG